MFSASHSARLTSGPFQMALGLIFFLFLLPFAHAQSGPNFYPQTASSTFNISFGSSLATFSGIAVLDWFVNNIIFMFIYFGSDWFVSRSSNHDFYPDFAFVITNTKQFVVSENIKDGSFLAHSIAHDGTTIFTPMPNVAFGYLRSNDSNWENGRKYDLALLSKISLYSS